MRARLLLPLLLLSIAVSPAYASFGGGSKPDNPPSQPSGSTTEASDGKTPRQQAESWYNDAYEDVTQAKDALAKEKPDTKKANKLFKRAIDRADRALEYDKTYFEALNLQGFSYRKLGNYEKSLAAYAACLAISPDFAPAHEYYGEALLESGNRDGASAQLDELKRLKADDLAKQLENALAATPATDVSKDGKSGKGKTSKTDAKEDPKADPRSSGATSGSTSGEQH
jgi:tetratricopeptide (TPR) repeat protein